MKRPSGETRGLAKRSPVLGDRRYVAASIDPDELVSLTCRRVPEHPCFGDGKRYWTAVGAPLDRVGQRDRRACRAE